MNANRRYIHSLLSILFVFGWFVMLFYFFDSQKTDWNVTALLISYLATILAGILGGVTFMLLSILKRGKIRDSFVYNLLGTLNIITGFLGMIFSKAEVNRQGYIASASLALGIVIYTDIYRRRIVIS
jgi:hypothetical protein